MGEATPPPLDLTPIRFETPVGDLTRAVVVETEDGARWFTSSRCVAPPGGWSGAVRARFVVTLDPVKVNSVTMGG